MTRSSFQIARAAPIAPPKNDPHLRRQRRTQTVFPPTGSVPCRVTRYSLQDYTSPLSGTSGVKTAIRRERTGSRRMAVLDDFTYCAGSGCRKNSTPSVPGPQWEDTVQPAWVIKTSLKGASSCTSAVSWRSVSSGTSPEWVRKA